MEEKNLVTLSNKVADYLEYMKKENYTLLGALKLAGHISEMNEYMDDYFNISSNQEKFALAWINGYKVEEKNFLVKVKNCIDACYLNYSTENKNFFFSNSKGNERYKTKFTKTFLEKNSFDWVFNCEGVELIEVKE